MWKTWVVVVFTFGVLRYLRPPLPCRGWHGSRLGLAICLRASLLLHELERLVQALLLLLQIRMHVQIQRRTDV